MEDKLVKNLFKALERATNTPSPPPDFASKVLEKLDDNRNPSRKRWMAAFILAACIIIFLLIGIRDRNKDNLQQFILSPEVIVYEALLDNY